VRKKGWGIGPIVRFSIGETRSETGWRAKALIAGWLRRWRGWEGADSGRFAFEFRLGGEVYFCGKWLI